LVKGLVSRMQPTLRLQGFLSLCNRM